MTPVSTTTSTLLGTTLLAAALSLPSLQSAYADAAPDRGVVSLKYLDYKDSQSVLGNSITDTVSGASS